MKKTFLRAVVLLLVASGILGGKVYAQNGQPHTLKADVTFQDVSLSWKAPADKYCIAVA